MTDFGIVRSLDAVGQTETGTVLGTSHYIAPEQARGERVDAHTDVYSFGVVLYELLAGEVPYPGDNFLTVAMKHVNEPVPNVLERRPDAPLRLATLIERCMAKAPRTTGRRRWTTSSASSSRCSAELDAKDGGEATMIIKPKAAPKPTRAPRQRGDASGRFRSGPLLVGALLLVAVVGGILLAGRDGDNPGAADGSTVELQGRRRRSTRPRAAATARSTSERVGDATDGDPATYWRRRSGTDSFSKPGVGLVLDAARSVSCRRSRSRPTRPGSRRRSGPATRRRAPSRRSSARPGPSATARPGISTGRSAVLRGLDHTARPGSAHINEAVAN